MASSAIRRLLAAACCSSALSCAVASAQLSHLWSFDADFNDSVGGANGTAIAGSGSVTITSSPGEFLVGTGGLKIVHGGGDADYVDITQPVFPIFNPMTFSVNLFYRFDPTLGTDDSRNFLFETTPNFSVGMGMGSTDDMEWFFAGGPSDTSGPVTNDGQWHQATLVWDKAITNTASFYHDGALRDQVDIGAADFDQIGQEGGLHIGTFRAANDRNWSGFIDEFAIYGDALTPSEVTALYVNAFGAAPPDPSLEFVNAIDLVTPVVGANRNVTTLGWGVGNYATVAGDGNDLGDAGYLGGNYGITNSSGDQTITIELTNLPAHNRVSIDGLLAQLDSLDPVRDGDFFSITLDGAEIFNAGFGFGTSDDGAFNEPVYADPDGALVLGDADLFGGTNFNENVYSLGRISSLRNVPHSASTMTLVINGNYNQTGGEFYGLDRLEISLGSGPIPVEVAGDANGDGQVNEADFFLISDNLSNVVPFGKSGDVDRDGQVTYGDFRLWKNNASQAALVALGFATNVPEPTALAIVGLAGLLACAKRRR